VCVCVCVCVCVWCVWCVCVVCVCGVCVCGVCVCVVCVCVCVCVVYAGACMPWYTWRSRQREIQGWNSGHQVHLTSTSTQGAFSLALLLVLKSESVSTEKNLKAACHTVTGDQGAKRLRPGWN